MTTLSVLVPHQGWPLHRDRIWQFVAGLWAELMPEAEIVTAGLGPEPPLCGPLAHNSAARQATGDVFFATCNDYLPDPKAMADAMALIDDGAQWVAPFGHTAYLTEACTAALFEAPDPHVVPLEYEEMIPFCNGLVMTTRDAWFAVGGRDERFRGPGPDDIAQRQALATLVGPGLALPHVGVHCWHERGDDDPEGFAALFAENTALYDNEYLPAVANPEAMRHVLGLPA